MTRCQQNICFEHGSEYLPSKDEQVVGIALSTMMRGEPLHGLRHIPEAGTSGWYLWRGDYREDESFFSPICASHICDHAAEGVKFLGLAPGFRFLVSGDYEDVWFDPKLLEPNL